MDHAILILVVKVHNNFITRSKLNAPFIKATKANVTDYHVKAKKKLSCVDLRRVTFCQRVFKKWYELPVCPHNQFKRRLKSVPANFDLGWCMNRSDEILPSPLVQVTTPHAIFNTLHTPCLYEVPRRCGRRYIDVGFSVTQGPKESFSRLRWIFWNLLTLLRYQQPTRKRSTNDPV